MNYFGVSESDIPTARLINMENQKKFSINSDKLTLESILQMCEEVIEGSAKVTHVQKKPQISLRSRAFKPVDVSAAGIL